MAQLYFKLMKNFDAVCGFAPLGMQIQNKMEDRLINYVPIPMENLVLEDLKIAHLSFL
jgi:hypothetical protein